MPIESDEVRRVVEAATRRITLETAQKEGSVKRDRVAIHDHNWGNHSSRSCSNSTGTEYQVGETTHLFCSKCGAKVTEDMSVMRQVSHFPKLDSSS